MTLNDGTRLIVQSRSNSHMKESIDSKLYEKLTWCGSDCNEHSLSNTDINAWIEITVLVSKMSVFIFFDYFETKCTVTMNSPNSNVVFGDCIDAVDNLIQEWYPGGCPLQTLDKILLKSSVDTLLCSSSRKLYATGFHFCCLF